VSFLNNVTVVLTYDCSINIDSNLTSATPLTIIDQLKEAFRRSINVKILLHIKRLVYTIAICNTKRFIGFIFFFF